MAATLAAITALAPGTAIADDEPGSGRNAGQNSGVEFMEHRPGSVPGSDRDSGPDTGRDSVDSGRDLEDDSRRDGPDTGRDSVDSGRDGPDAGRDSGPDSRQDSGPDAGRDAVDSGQNAKQDSGQNADIDLMEFVPDEDPADGCIERSGPYQRQVEQYLKLRVDGRQSDADCEAIKAFQTARGITPDTGYAGPVTWGHMRLDQARGNPNAAGKCPVRSGRVVCVDLSRQLLWVQNGRKVTYGPIPARTGQRGYRTRVGWHRIYQRKRDQVSEIYGTKMPFSQFFNGGQALHGIKKTKSVYSPPGSFGCINLAYDNAQRLWSVVKLKDRVYVWGRKPGT